MRQKTLALLLLSLLLPASLSAQTFRPRIMSGLRLTMLPGQTQDPMQLINSSGVVLALLNSSGRFEVAVLTNAGACTDAAFSLAAVLDGTLCVDTSAGAFYFRTGGAWTTISPGGITSLNGLTGATQTFSTGTAGTDFGISSSGSVHTFNLPDAGATARGLVTSSNQTFGGTKTTPIWNASTGFQVGGLGTTGRHLRGNGTNLVLSATAAAGVGTCAASQWADVLNDDAVPTCTQPGFSDLSGSALLAQLPFGTANQFLSTNPGATTIEHKTLAVGTGGTDFNIAHATGTTTFNLPNASPSNRGVVSTVTQSFVGQKTFTGNLIAALAFQVTNNEAELQAGVKVTGVAKLPSIQSTGVTGDLIISIAAGNGIGANEAGGLINLQGGNGLGSGDGGDILIQPGIKGATGAGGIVNFNMPAGGALRITQSGLTPSSTGLVRMPFNRFIYSRNFGNTSNIRMLGIDTFTGTNEVWVGDRALGVGMRTESIIVSSDATVVDDLFISNVAHSDGWVFNNVTYLGAWS